MPTKCVVSKQNFKVSKTTNSGSHSTIHRYNSEIGTLKIKSVLYVQEVFTQVTHYKKWVTTSWTYGTYTRAMQQAILKRMTEFTLVLLDFWSLLGQFQNA